MNSSKVLACSALVVLIVSSFIPTAEMTGMPGGVTDLGNAENNLELQELGEFAIKEHNSKQNVDLEFMKVVSAKQQVVAGILYYLTIEAKSGGKRGHYEAKVWMKPWEKHQSLEDFRSLGPMVSAADLGSAAPETRSLPVDDPAVSEAAETAVKQLQQRSNSLFPYELSEVVSAQSQGDDNKLHLVLKLKRGTRDEMMKTEVHLDEEGDWSLKGSTPYP